MDGLSNNSFMLLCLSRMTRNPMDVMGVQGAVDGKEIGLGWRRQGQGRSTRGEERRSDVEACRRRHCRGGVLQRLIKRLQRGPMERCKG